jgi:hypothetical protein
MQAFTALATRPHGHHPYLPWLTKGRKKSAFAAVAHLLCKTLLPFAGVTFIARPLKNEIPCGFADHLRFEKMPIVRFMGTKVAEFFPLRVAELCLKRHNLENVEASPQTHQVGQFRQA